MVSTAIPLFVLAFLQSPADNVNVVNGPALTERDISSWLVPQENLICWQAPDKGLCLPYTDEGTHLIVHLNGVE
jgi:hypothetical protein